MNSSEISETKVAICFMSLSTEDSAPVLSRVVMARVAMERLESVIRFSRSRLQAVTAAGWVMDTWLSVLTAANLSVALGEEQKSWRTDTAGTSSRAVVLRMLTMAWAAS